MNEKIKKILRDMELCNGFYDFILEPEKSEILFNYIMQLQEENKKQQEVIDKVTNDLQQIIDNVKDRTIISLGQFIPKLEVIQDELNGSNDILKEVSE